MLKNLKKFGENLKNLRIEKELSLREICKEVDYDASNWSKIERGIISPPSDEKVLSKWARVLGIKSQSKEFKEFIDSALVAQGIIPEDVLSREDAFKYLPAVFRTLRNEKPTKEEIDRLIELIRNA
ncbi:MAG TPA: transcriptional regulator [Candidatus Portnoybacteria bacterium]|jgi:transcriptional regulator with XRE-family HTH domain|nr:transcriptional regulator [Candidatus Portnoybacteria bacterium]MDD5752400.1 transcriptional regulator [Candidatus Portnoybacteria bacterium]HOZ16356.1 transcriptional regulator [Candidatus Portnoybacteria bacterium]HPH52212.1 transcriptional regulator [Candidatus Portnoybacteria bacterium]HPJ80432.1 transcriptional regulator [Candidatus Portnoybacteria bacterium]